MFLFLKLTSLGDDSRLCENITVQLNAQGQAVVNTSGLTDGSFGNCPVYSTTPAAKIYTSANIGTSFQGVGTRSRSQRLVHGC